MQSKTKISMEHGITRHTAIERARSRVLGLGIIKSSKFQDVYEDVKKEYLYKNNVYPDDGTKAFEQLQHHISTKVKKQKKGH